VSVFENYVTIVYETVSLTDMGHTFMY